MRSDEQKKLSNEIPRRHSQSQFLSISEMAEALAKLLLLYVIEEECYFDGKVNRFASVG